MSFADAFNAPLVITAGGKTYNLPLFTMDDLAAVSREVLNEQKQEAIGRLALTDTAGRTETAAWFDASDLDVQELSRVVRTTKGARRFIARSFIAGGGAAGELLAFLESVTAERGFMGFVTLAMDLSRLWPPRKRDEGKGPNAGSAVGDSAAPAAATPTVLPGDNTASSSAAPSAETTPAT